MAFNKLRDIGLASILVGSMVSNVKSSSEYNIPEFYENPNLYENKLPNYKDSDLNPPILLKIEKTEKPRLLPPRIELPPGIRDHLLPKKVRVHHREDIHLPDGRIKVQYRWIEIPLNDRNPLKLDVR
jgi:hypothetical protein